MARAPSFEKVAEGFAGSRGTEEGGFTCRTALEGGPWPGSWRVPCLAAGAVPKGTPCLEHKAARGGLCGVRMQARARDTHTHAHTHECMHM